MSSKKVQIVCLANSEKNSDRCIAGKTGNSWIRPVSTDPTKGLKESERRCKDGSEPELLDVIEITVKEASPFKHQSENKIMDTTEKWEKKGVASWNSLQQLIDTPRTLWKNGNSSYNGLNDRIHASDMNLVKESLYLIEPQDLIIKVEADAKQFGDTTINVRAEFTYNGTDYRLKVTDPIASRYFRSKGDGHYKVGEAYICVSLAAESIKDEYYKLAASIILKNKLK